MGKTAHVKNLAALWQEGANVGAGVHGLGQNVRVVLRRLWLPDKSTKYASERNSLLHSPAGRGRSESLQVKGQVVLNGSRRLDGLHLERRTDVGQGAGPEWKGLWVMCLPPLVLGTEIEGAGVLEVRRENDGLVAGFARQLDTEVPRI
jgi:hypothetical protein